MRSWVRSFTRSLAFAALSIATTTARAQLPVTPQSPGKTPSAIPPRTVARGRVALLGEDADAACLPAFVVQGESLILSLDPPPADSARIVRSLGGDERSAWITLPPAVVLAADAPELATRVRAARHVAFVESDLMTWLVMLYPQGAVSELVAALHEAQRRGAVIVGRGTTVLLLTTAGVVRGPDAHSPGEVRIVERNPRKLGEPRLGWGTALIPWAAVDTGGRSADRLERLCAALVEGPLRVGVFLGKKSALWYDAEHGSFDSLGADPLVLIDVRSARRGRFGLDDARVSLLWAGDRWDERHRSVLPIAGSAQVAASDLATERTVDDVFAYSAWRAFGESADGTAPPRVWDLRDASRSLTIEVEPDSALQRHAGVAQLALSRLRLSIHLAASGWDAVKDAR
jgi:hypothetical protein